MLGEPTDSIFYVYLLQVSGPSGQMTWIRGGPDCLDARNISEAIDNRLVPLVKSSFTWGNRM